MFYTEIGRRPILLKGSPFGYTDPKQDMSQGAQELGCTGTRAHMNYKVHNTCHHEFWAYSNYFKFLTITIMHEWFWHELKYFSFVEFWKIYLLLVLDFL